MIFTFKKNHTYQLFLILLVCFFNLICNNAWGAASADQIKQWLDSHNQYRLKHQVEPLTWSTTIAASAQEYADTCPTGHSQSGYGENMAWGYSSIPAAVTGWYKEEYDYDYANPGFSSAVGHFTQVVWKGTVEIGCALKTQCPQWPTTWICQYNPPGNYQGQFAQNVFPPKASPPPVALVGNSSVIPVILLLLE
jgi:uncharacterized protein YkwD